MTKHLRLPRNFDNLLSPVTGWLKAQRDLEGNYKPWVLALPNALTYSRLTIVPLGPVIGWAAWHGHRTLALWALVVSMVLFATDAFDGTIARLTDNISQHGANVDPVIDRLGLVSLLVAWLVLTHHQLHSSFALLGVMLLIRLIVEFDVATTAARELRAGLPAKSEVYGKYKFCFDLLALLLGLVAVIWRLPNMQNTALVILAITLPLSILTARAHHQQLRAR